jgi:hypothetical protein
MCRQVISFYCVDICSKSFQECKQILREYLTKLELAGLVSPADGYQSIVSAIAEDICNKRRQRKLQRKVIVLHYQYFSSDECRAEIEKYK